MNKLKINWFSSAPWGQNGYSIQTRINVPRIKALGYDMSISAFYGLSGAVMTTPDGTKVYPLAKHLYGQDMIGAHAVDAGANAIITLLDAWVVQPENMQGLPWYPWFPIDTEPISPKVLRSVARAKKAIVMSKYGLRMAEQAGLDVYYVPHSVDTNVFKPLDRTQARERLGFPRDKFIIGMVAANKGVPSRKSFYEQITAFAAFRNEHPDSMLYLHTDDGTFGHDILDLTTYLKVMGLKYGYVDTSPLPDDLAVAFVDQYQNQLGIQEQYLVDAYNAFDVLTLCSMGEGFGIPLIEAQACGCPVITGDWTAMSELCFSGWKIPKKEAAPTFHPFFEAFQYQVKVDAVVRCYLDAYRLKGNLDYRGRARDGAMPYDADKVTDKYWKSVLSDIEKNQFDVQETKLVNVLGGHYHTWAKVGLYNSDGSLSVPCINCDDELRGNRIIKSGFAPKFSSGVTLDLAPDTDGVNKIVCREIQRDYQLDDLDLKPGDVVVDIGAHKGVVSCYLAKRYPGITVLAFEPVKENFDAMLENKERNGVDIIPIKYAVTWNGRDTVITTDRDNSGGSNIYAEFGDVNIESITLKEIFDNYFFGRLALLKIDCEGSEFEILQNAGDLLDRIDHLRGEFHKGAGNPDALLELVKAHIPDVKVTVQG